MGTHFLGKGEQLLAVFLLTSHLPQMTTPIVTVIDTSFLVASFAKYFLENEYLAKLDKICSTIACHLRSVAYIIHLNKHLKCGTFLSNLIGDNYQVPTIFMPACIPGNA